MTAAQKYEIEKANKKREGNKYSGGGGSINPRARGNGTSDVSMIFFLLMILDSNGTSSQIKYWSNDTLGDYVRDDLAGCHY